jgi:hypothetical protein
MIRFERIAIGARNSGGRSARRGRVCGAVAVLGCFGLGLALVGLAGAPVAQASDENQQAAATAPIAEVASVSGTVEAIGLDGQTRALQIGDPIQAGERVQTGPGSTAGIWHDEVLAQLAEKSRAKVDRNAEGQARVTLEDGAVRVVDPRKEGAPVELVALDASSTVLGGDREARILREKAGAYAMLCDWAKPVAVARRAQGATAGPGDCVIAHPREAMFAAPGHKDRIPLLAGAPALADAGPAIDPASLIDPLPPVGAAGPGGAGVGATNNGGPGNGPPGLPLALRSPCTTVGAGCLGGQFEVIEPPPTEDPVPGANGGFPGGGVVPDGRRR